MTGSALIAGASGSVGNNLARHLLGRGWRVGGLARRPPAGIEGLEPVAAMGHVGYLLVWAVGGYLLALRSFSRRLVI